MFDKTKFFDFIDELVTFHNDGKRLFTGTEIMICTPQYSPNRRKWWFSLTPECEIQKIEFESYSKINELCNKYGATVSFNGSRFKFEIYRSD